MFSSEHDQFPDAADRSPLDRASHNVNIDSIGEPLRQCVKLSLGCGLSLGDESSLQVEELDSLYTVPPRVAADRDGPLLNPFVYDSEKEIVADLGCDPVINRREKLEIFDHPIAVDIELCHRWRNRGWLRGKGSLHGTIGVDSREIAGNRQI